MGRKKERFEFPPEQRQAAPTCPYFGRCGGCRYQDVEYRLQVEAKARWLSELFGRAVEVVPSPVAYGYRNRMDFVNAFDKLGLREAGSYKTVVDIEQCPLMNERANRLLGRIRALLERHLIPCYDYIRHEGYLRYVVLRSTRRGDTLVNFVTADESPHIEPVIQEIQNEATGVVWSIQDGLADVSFGRIHCTYAAPTIREKLGGRVFQMGPNTFFQNNPWLIERVVEDLRPWIQGRILDLYCGVGCLGIALADRADQVLGVESVEPSIALARDNAQQNEVVNIEFETAPVRPWLRERIESLRDRCDVVILDPPREGLTPKVVRSILRIGPERIIYISCNPKMLQQEIGLMADTYERVSLKGYDFFPQTPHVEAVAMLEKKSGD